MKKETLFVIPARGGSKGIPYKNIKDFCGKPLIYYSIDIARDFVNDEDICVSTDDKLIMEIVQKYGLDIPFIRPEELATDTATSNDVLLHAIKEYEKREIFYDKIVLLQPTSPLRQAYQVAEALELYCSDIDMVISVCKSDIASVLCQEDSKGYLVSLFNKNHSRRQDVKSLYEVNGAIYIINVESLKEKGLVGLEKKIKYNMPEESSIDIDTPLDWIIAETIYKMNQKFE